MTELQRRFFARERMSQASAIHNAKALVMAIRSAWSKYDESERLLLADKAARLNNIESELAELQFWLEDDEINAMFGTEIDRRKK